MTIDFTIRMTLIGPTSNAEELEARLREILDSAKAEYDEFISYEVETQKETP